MTQPQFTDFYTILPFTILVVWASLLLLADLFIPRGRKGITAFLAAFGLAGTMGYTITQIGLSSTGFNGMVTLDGFSTFANVLLLISMPIGWACENMVGRLV